MSCVLPLVVLALFAGPAPPAAADVDALMELYEARDYSLAEARLTPV